MKVKTLSSAITILSLLGLNYTHAETSHPTIPLLTIQDVTTGCDTKIDQLKQQLLSLEQTVPSKNKAQFTKQWFSDWNKFSANAEDFANPIEILSNVSTDATFRKSAEDCLVKFSQFSTDIYQNKKLYALFKATAPQDAIDQKLKHDVIFKFENNGIGLSEEKQKQFKEISTKLTELSQEFSRNIRDNNSKLSFTAEQLKGLPESYINNLKKDANGHYLVGFEYPEYYPFMQLADDDAARKQYYIAFTKRGTEKNLDILKQIIDLRYKQAQLFGLASYADWVVQDRMAENPTKINQFLEQVHQQVAPLEKADVKKLQEFKAKTLNIPVDQAKIEPWSSSYWSEKYRKANFNIDQEDLRKYFPTEASLKWLLAVTSELYAVRFEETKVPVWHQDVRYFNVFDTKSNQFLGGLYIDPYPREGKYGHAAVWPIYGSSTLLNRTPVATLVTNFNRKGLSSDELETFVHEFGHAMHNILSNTRYVDLAGTSVEHDFVEAPSQMYEEWARNLKTLQKVAQYCSPACPQVDQALIKKLNEAHNYGRGMRYARQTLYAQYDMKLHGPNALNEQPLKVWQDMESQTALGYVPTTEFPGQFNHIASGYGAGYYGYMWSEVIALDMLSAYGNNLMNTNIGAKYRQEVLSQGSQKPAKELIKNFLGREPNNKAFFEEINGQRLK